MENPASWPPEAKVIFDALVANAKATAEGIIGQSDVMAVYRALLEAGMLCSAVAESREVANAAQPTRDAGRELASKIIDAKSYGYEYVWPSEWDELAREVLASQPQEGKLP